MVSSLGSRGIFSTRSAMMLRWISSVPPAIDVAGTDNSTSATIPSAGPSAPASNAPAPATSVCTLAAIRATLLDASLPNDPSGPCGLPCSFAVRALRAVHSADFAITNSRPISWRTTGSSIAPLATACGITRSTRPARCGYQRYGSIVVAISARSSSYARPAPSVPLAQLRSPSAPRRSCISVVFVTVQPSPTVERISSGGTMASVRNTWLKLAYPFICRSGCTVTPGCFMSIMK